jgi:hypothetical protein
MKAMRVACRCWESQQTLHWWKSGGHITSGFLSSTQTKRTPQNRPARHKRKAFIDSRRLGRCVDARNWQVTLREGGGEVEAQLWAEDAAHRTPVPHLHARVAFRCTANAV